MAANKIESKLEKDENLIAVVMTDDFDENFSIITENKPKCLLPLANKEMIDYTLEFLQSSNVQDCYVYCSKHVQQIKEHLSRMHWIKSAKNEPQVCRSKMNVHVIADENCHSFGDAMRDLDEKGILRSHFILTSADVVSNVNIDTLIKEHKHRYDKSKDTTLTLVYQHADPGHQSRSKSQEVLLVTKRESNRILYHSRAKNSFERKTKGHNRVQLPLELFTGSGCEETEVRYDLADTGIAICAPTVPLQFAERFDCQTLDDFIKGSIEDDIADHFLYAAVIGDTGNGNVCTGYAAKVADFLTYLSVTNDVLNRWVYPLVPEANISSIGKKAYHVSRHNVYKAECALLLQGSKLQQNVIIGPDTVIGENTVLDHVSVGRGCKIGSNTSIFNSVLYDNIKIGSNCKLNQCIVSEKVVIGDNVVIHEKSIIEPGFYIKDNCIKRYLSTEVPAEEGLNTTDDADEKVKSDLAYIEKVWGEIAVSDDESTDSSFRLDYTDNDSDADDSGVPDIINDPDAKFQRFYQEVLESLQRGLEEDTDGGNLVLEINASRHAYAMTQPQVIKSVIMSVLSIGTISARKIDTTSHTYLAEIRTKLDFFKNVLKKYVKNEESELNCLKGIELHCRKDESFLTILPKTIHFMFDQMEVLSEESILSYYYNQSIADDFQHEHVDENSIIYKVKRKLDPLVKWLEEPDSDDTDSGITIPKL